MFQAGGIQLISDLRWSDRENSHYSCGSKMARPPFYSLQIWFPFHALVILIPVNNRPFLYFHSPTSFVPLLIIPHLQFLIFPSVVPGQSTKQQCSFYTFPLLHPSILSPPPTPSISKPHSSSIMSPLPFFLYSFSFLFICFSLSSSFAIAAMFPYVYVYPYPLPFPSLPLLQIQLDSHSLPGLNHQDLLEGPNRGSVSPQRGFCLLTVETNDLHALCLWSVPQHLEAVEVITVICLTRQATAHSHLLPLHLPLTVKVFFRCHRNCRVALNIQEPFFFFQQWLKDTKPKQNNKQIINIKYWKASCK